MVSELTPFRIGQQWIGSSLSIVDLAIHMGNKYATCEGHLFLDGTIVYGRSSRQLGQQSARIRDERDQASTHHSDHREFGAFDSDFALNESTLS